MSTIAADLDPNWKDGFPRRNDPPGEKYGAGILNPRPNVTEMIEDYGLDPRDQEHIDSEAALMEARHLLHKMYTRAHRFSRTEMKVPGIESVHIHTEGNMTIAVVNGNKIGWAKFNPNDVITLQGKSRRGRTWYKDKSKFSPEAGRLKALHRALSKLLPKEEHAGQLGQ